MDEHHKFMTLALKQAYLAKGNTYPNPAVGCIIVQNKSVIGEGYTQKYGNSHAEVIAIKSSTAPVKNSTMYVTLEPCSHYGKTPPCSDFIIQNQIKTVFIATQDSFKKVSGQGIKKLKKANISIIIGVMEKEIQEFYQDYFHFIKTGVPLIILKIAQSKDGFINTLSQIQTKITGIECQQWTHKLRNRVDSILIGANSLRIDNPSLKPYYIKDVPHSKTTVLIWSYAQTEFPSTYQIFKKSSKRETIILSPQNLNLPKHVKHVLLKVPSINCLFDTINKLPLHSVLIEGGSWVLQQWLKTSYWNIFYILTSNKTLNQGLSWKKDLTKGIPFSKENYKTTHIHRFKNDSITQITKGF